MDILKPSEMRSKGREDLARVITGYRLELARLKMGVTTGQNKKVSDVGKLRRAVARALTIVTEPEGTVVKQVVAEKKKTVTKEAKRGKAK